jgi:hypothetical protein
VGIDDLARFEIGFGGGDDADDAVLFDDDGGVGLGFSGDRIDYGCVGDDEGLRVSAESQKAEGQEVLEDSHRLFFFFELDHHDFNGFGAAINVGVHGVGWVGGEPIRFACIPLVAFGGAGLVDDLHEAAAEGDDDAGMLVTMHREWLVGQDDGAPDFDIFVVELGEALRGGLLGVDDTCRCEKKDRLRRNDELQAAS